MRDAETDGDRAALLLGQATCYSHVGEIAKSLELLNSARQAGQGHRDVLSQVALAEAGAQVLTGEYQLACNSYASIRTEYHDLLAEDEGFAVELDSRLACALVNAARFDEAIPTLRRLLERDDISDRQWLQIHLGSALANTAHLQEAQSLYLEAATGPDSAYSRTALEYLSAIGSAQ